VVQAESKAERQRQGGVRMLLRGPTAIAAIKAGEATDRFDRSKLLRLIEELNDNYLRGNGHAAHALLRAILDHVPPLLGVLTSRPL